MKVMNKWKNKKILILVPVLAVILAGAAWFLYSNRTPKIQEITAEADPDDTGEIQISVGKISNAAKVEQLTAAVWYGDDQAEEQEYPVVQENGKYSIQTSVTHFDYKKGTYGVSIRGIDKNGKEIKAKTASFQVTQVPSRISVTDTDHTESDFRITCDAEEEADGIRLAVWNDTLGIDQLQWYETEQDGSQYEADVMISDFGETGTYEVEAYRLDGDEMEYLDTAHFSVSMVPQGTVAVDQIDGSQGTYAVTASSLTAPSGISDIRAAVWSEEDQSNLCFYALDPQEDGSFAAAGNFAETNAEFGHYSVQLFVKMGNGVEEIAGTTDFDLTAYNYIQAGKASVYKETVTILNPNGGDCGNVSVKAWSDADGEFGAVWYTASDNGDGSYTAVVDSDQHGSGGNYTAAIYCNDRSVFLGSTGFQLDKYVAPAPVVAAAPAVGGNGGGSSADSSAGSSYAGSYSAAGLDQLLTAALAQTDGTLYGAYRYVVDSNSYGWASGDDPNVRAYNMLQTHVGNCYSFAAEFWAMARKLGYNAEYVEGYTSALRGGLTGHGWVEIDGVIYDPQLDNQTGNSGWAGQSPYIHVR